MQARLISILLINTLICVLINADQIPVLSYFGSSNQLTNTITVGKVLNSNDFLDQLKQVVKTNLNVILVDKLNTQDLSLLQKKFDLKENVVLEPQVESPFETLEKYSKENQVKLNLQEYKNVEEALHNFNKLHLTSNNVVLTGRNTNDLDQVNKRSKRQNENDKQPTSTNVTTTFVFGTQCAALFDSIYFYDQSNLQTSTYIYLPIQNGTHKFNCADANSTQSLTINFNNNTGLFGSSIVKIDLVFKKSGNLQYYELGNSSVYLENKNILPLVYMGSPYGMETPLNYSFVCTRTSFKIQNSTGDGKSDPKVWFYFENLQIQPSGMFPNGSNYTFGPVNYCQGFFSSGIWMAITASLILAAILAFGVSLLFNVKTMDRFDDPKGKPLNIGAEK